MARKRGKKAVPEQAVIDYRHEDAKRKNIPPAGLAAQGKIREKPKIQYAYNPHLPPILRFDRTGKTDGLPELLETARTRPLTLEEAELLAQALRKHEPWLGAIRSLPSRSGQGRLCEERSFGICDTL